MTSNNRLIRRTLRDTRLLIKILNHLLVTEEKIMERYLMHIIPRRILKNNHKTICNHNNYYLKKSQN